MKFFCLLLISAVFFFAGCASLDDSRLDHELKIQGTYVCPQVPVVRPKNENPDATVARCFQDSVVVARDKILWNRVLYSKADCSGDVQGSTHWNAPVLALGKQKENSAENSSEENTLIDVGALSEVKLVRRNPHWYYDVKGGHCDLRNVPVNSDQTPSGSWACENFFPPQTVAKHAQRMRFLSEEREGARTLIGHWRGKEVACGR